MRVREDLRMNTTAIAIIHIVYGSKTGLVHPSFSIIEQLQAEFQQRIVVVVDACQLRCELHHISRYAECGYLSLITSSKFYTAPPFAGAVVLPAVAIEEIETYLSSTFTSSSDNSTTTTTPCIIPTGLRQYLTPYEVPSSMPQLRSFLSDGGRNDWVNLGLHLRWSCGVDMMERYAALDSTAVANFTSQWEQRVRAVVSQHAPYLRLLPESPECASDMTSGVSGIVSIVVSVVDAEALQESHDAAQAFVGFKHLIQSRSGGATESPTSTQDASSAAVSMRALSFDELKVFHAEMTELSTGSTSTATTAGVEVPVAIRCAIGQPVKLADNGFAIVRIALGADMVVKALEQRHHTAATHTNTVDHERIAIEQILKEDDLVVTKMSLLARSWHCRGVYNKNSTTMADTTGSKECIDRQLLLSPSLSEHSASHFTTGTTTPNQAEGLTANTISTVLQQLYPGTCPVPEVSVFYDLDALSRTRSALSTAFTTAFPVGTTFNHCFAVKSAPLTYLLQDMVRAGLGLETASIMEVSRHSLFIYLFFLYSKYIFI